MRKSTRVVKRLLALFLVVLMSIESFAAVVSDNDGAAFITKAEFDSLKNDFQSQINRYNESIDNKIDGAISNYLAGITISREPNNIWVRLKETLGHTVYYKNDIPGTGTSTNTTGVILNGERHYTYRYINNLFGRWIASYSGGYYYLEYYVTAGYWPSTQGSGFQYANGGGRSSSLPLWSANSPESLGGGGRAAGGTATYGTKSITMKTSTSIPGAGDGWEWRTWGNGELCLYRYYNSIFPLMVIDLQAHTYLDKGEAKYSLGDSNFGDDTSLSLTIPPTSTQGTSESGTKIIGDDDTAQNLYYVLTNTMIKNHDGYNYLTYQWGKNTDVDLWGWDSEQNLVTEPNTTKINASQTATNFYENYHSTAGLQSKQYDLSGVEITYNKVKFPPNKKKLDEFSIETLSAIAGEIVHVGGGAPFFETVDEGQVRLRGKLLSFMNDGTVSNSDTIVYRISDKQFVDGNFAADSKLKYEGSALSNTDIDISFDVGGHHIYWISMYSQTSGYTATIDDVILKLN